MNAEAGGMCRAGACDTPGARRRPHPPRDASFVRGTETRREQEPELAEREQGDADLPLSRGPTRAGSRHPRIRSQARGRRPTTEPPAPCGCFNCSREGNFPAGSTPTYSVVWGLNKVFKTLLTTSHRDCRQPRVSHRHGPVFSSSFIY